MNDDRTQAQPDDDSAPAHHDGILAADATGLVAQQEFITLVTEHEPEMTAGNDR